MQKKMKEEIKRAIQKALQEPYQTDIPTEGIEIEAPRNKDHGDFASNIALKLAKELKKNPMDLAGELALALEKIGFMGKIVVEPPGFINFYLADGWMLQVLELDEGYYQGLWPREWKVDSGIESQLKEKDILIQIREIQYVHSRITSIEKILGEEGISVKHRENTDIAYRQDEIEKKILEVMVKYPDLVENTVKSRQWQEIIGYGAELSKLFLGLQDAAQFRKMEKPKLYGTLKLMNGIKLILRDLLCHLGLGAPEKM